MKIVVITRQDRPDESWLLDGFALNGGIMVSSADFKGKLVDVTQKYSPEDICLVATRGDTLERAAAQQIAALPSWEGLKLIIMHCPDSGKFGAALRAGTNYLNLPVSLLPSAVWYSVHSGRAEPAWQLSLWVDALSEAIKYKDAQAFKELSDELLTAANAVKLASGLDMLRAITTRTAAFLENLPHRPLPSVKKMMVRFLRHELRDRIIAPIELDVSRLRLSAAPNEARKIAAQYSIGEVMLLLRSSIYCDGGPNSCFNGTGLGFGSLEDCLIHGRDCEREQWGSFDDGIRPSLEKLKLLQLMELSQERLDAGLDKLEELCRCVKVIHDNMAKLLESPLEEH